MKQTAENKMTKSYIGLGSNLGNRLGNIRFALAAMGQMVGNIAHQWRQPLNVLSLDLANILDAHQYGQLTDEYLAATIHNVVKYKRKYDVIFFREDTL